MVVGTQNIFVEDIAYFIRIDLGNKKQIEIARLVIATTIVVVVGGLQSRENNIIYVLILRDIDAGFPNQFFFLLVFLFIL